MYTPNKDRTLLIKPLGEGGIALILEAFWEPVGATLLHLLLLVVRSPSNLAAQVPPKTPHRLPRVTVSTKTQTTL